MKTITHIIDLTENVEPVQEDWSIEKWNTGLYEAVQVNGTKIRILCTDKPGIYPIAGYTPDGNIYTWYKNGVLNYDPLSNRNLRLIRKQPECIEDVKYQYFRDNGEFLGNWSESRDFLNADYEIKLIYLLPKK